MNSSNVDYRPESGDTTLRDYLRVLFRQKTVILTAVLTVCATVVIGLELKTNVYESSVKMLIAADKQVESPYYRQMSGARDIQQTLTQSEIVRSNPVLGRVVSALALDKRPLDDEKKFSSLSKRILIDYRAKALNKKLENIEEAQKNAFLFNRAILSLKQNIKVEPIRDTNMFTISAKDYNPVGSAIIANVVSRSYVIFDLEQQLAELKLKYGEKHPTVNLIKDSIEELKKTLSGAPMDDMKAIGPASVKIMEQAVMPIEPAGTPKKLTLILAVFMSVFLAVMLAFVFEYADQTFRSPLDVENYLNMPFLGSLPRQNKGNKVIVDSTNAHSAYAVSFQNLSDQIYMLVRDKKLKTLLFTSAMEREGTSTIVANLGIFLTQKLLYNVLVIDANLRNHSINACFGVSNTPGMAEIIEQNVSFKEAVRSIDLKEVTEGGNENTAAGDTGLKEINDKEAKKINLHLDVLAAGKTDLNPATLLSSKKMEEILQEANKNYDIVLIDCANMTGFKDAAVLSPNVDGIVLVVNESKTRRQVVKSVLEPLKKSRANILGVILNNRTFVIPKFIYDNV